MKSPSQYSDVAKVLDAALAAGGGLYRLPTSGKAIRWRQRAYGLRKLLIEIDEKRKQGLAPAGSPYDTMILRIHESDPCVVRIETLQPEGELTTLGNAPMPALPTVTAYDPIDDDPYLEEIKDLVKERGV
jgi:hypothetical protein